MADFIIEEKPIQILPVSTVTIVDGKLPLAGIDAGLDLTEYQGLRPCKIRIVREQDGSISVDPAKGYWLEQEIDIPARQEVLTPVLDAKTANPVLDEDGAPLMEAKVVPTTSVTVKTWER